ncbi:sensor histidine kinase [Halomonadaceae bacterium KBTZ08]
MWDDLVSWLGTDLMPHGHCFLWRYDLLLLHVGSDLLIALAYFSIPVALWLFVKRRTDLAFNWIFIMFALFIFACGATHLLDAWNIWNDHYYVEGGMKAVTAVVSVATAIAVWPLLPKALQLPSPSVLQAANEHLLHEIEQRQAAEQSLREASEQLEQRVAERTRELEQANAELESEVLDRRRAENRFRRLFETTPNGLVLVDGDGQIVLANQQSGAIFGYEPDELKGMAVEALVPDEVRAHHGQYRDSYMIAPQARAMGQGRDLYGVRKDGSSVSLEIGLSPIQEGDRTEVIASIVDNTERKQFEHQIQRQNEALTRSNQELEQFAFIASHDLREPLRKVLSFGKLLASGRYGSFNAKGDEFIGYMMDAAERMQQLLDSLLSYSRVTSKALPFEMVDLNKVAEVVTADLQITLEESGASVDWQDLATVEADPVQMRQLFQNLIANSLKYQSPERAPVMHISAQTQPDGRCRLTFTDNGIGFDPQYSEQIFQVFQRLHARHEYEGTGMGLAICRKILERHRGTIWATGESGVGARFEIVLPYEQPGGESVWNPKLSPS